MKRVLMFLFCALSLFQVFAQNRSLSGTVSDEGGSPLVGATISVVGTTINATTSANGTFSLMVPTSAREIEISYVGFTTQRLSIGSQTNFNVRLSTTSNNIDEVVVTGYTREKKSNYAGAVSKVTSKQINNIPMASVDQILQGRAPGLYVSSGSGQPGNSATVIIRGIGTISGSSTPLYIIDGIPVQAGAFSALSPSDIESVDVLKDAVSTALYGSRGANGVIVITTKRGKTGGGRTVVGFKSQIGFSERVTETFQMMDSKQRIQYEEEIGAETGLNIGPGWTYSRKNPANISLPAATLTRYDFIRDSLSNMDVDWRDIFFRRGKFQEHEVNASGGSDKVSFYSSFNYFKQEGISIRSGLERYSLRNNVDFRSDRFTAALSTTLNFAQSSFIESENTTAVTNPFASVYYALPYEQPYINGQLVHAGIAYGQNGSPFNVLDQREGTTALERLLSTTSRRNEIKGVVGANLRYKLTNRLALISTLGLDFRDLVTDRFIDPRTYTGTQVAGGQGLFGESVGRGQRLYGNGGLNYTNNFAEKHAIDLTAIYEGIKNNSRSFSYTGYGLNPLLPNTPAAITPGSAAGGFIPLVGGSRDFIALQSAIGIAKYTYNDKYTINANFRRDGTSTVPEKNRWKSFYSVGATWNAAKEDFLKDVQFISDLQLRVGYGTSASPFSSSFGYLSTYSSDRYAGVTALGVSGIGNEEYDWEYAKTSNVGVDFSTFRRRLRGSVDLYNKNTENLFISQELSRTSGVSALNVNAGKLRNRGIELTLNADLIQSRDLRFSVGGNIAYNSNEITDLGQVNEFVQGTGIIRVGLPIGSHYITRWGGVDAATGSPLYYTKDGVLTTSFNSSSMSVADFGSWVPPTTGGFNGSFSFKGIYAEAFFSFASGNKRFNNEDFFNETPSFATSNQSIRLLDRWRKPGDVTDIQRFGTSRSFSSKDIQDASFVRFRNFNVGYNLPSSLTSGFIKSATVFMQGQNLYTWTKWRGFDPEDNNNISTFEYPNARTFTFGINATF